MEFWKPQPHPPVAGLVLHAELRGTWTVPLLGWCVRIAPKHEGKGNSPGGLAMADASQEPYTAGSNDYKYKNPPMMYGSVL